VITIRICSSLPDAQVIQSYLGGSGIKAFFPDEFTIQNYWLWSNAIGGVRVQVPEEDADRAAEILCENPDHAKIETEKTCPKCGAPLKETYGLGLLFKIALALLFSIPMRSKPTWHCPSCGCAPGP